MTDNITLTRAAALDGVAHGFLGRTGGVSTGNFASLNCRLGSSEDPAVIARNRRIACDAVLPGAGLAALYQVHSATCVTVDGPIANEARPEADALVTHTPGVLLGILTADCAPVLFADREAGVIGAAHAGWKGAFAGITDSTIAAMEALGAERDRIRCAIGPCIARASYEVDQGFYERFLDQGEENDRFFSAGKPGHHQFDVEAYVVHRVAAAGIRIIEAPGIDTYANEALYYSYRRDCHRGNADYGCQLSLIGLRP